MRAEKLTEKQLAKQLPQLLQQVGLELLATEVTLGKYRLDAVAKDSRGSLVVIEVKTKARLDAIGQLFLYPRALARFAREEASASASVRSALITTHLDKNVVDLMESLELPHAIDLWVCVGTKRSELRLVRPSEASDEQCWDQFEEGSMARTKAVREHLARNNRDGA